ncbi:sphingomyelin phosphodiesterase 5 isoform X2 [Alligator mississippiensis]|uniref:sphingomyelin phosphodiesterase 5 isoform X2 n=1 Tax=Alligator mississippiensis TaxID=8496 RepID=UPI002877C227|nr:sphingomyelin phosphodiesterase 5 isoform X2 [Alligator mississippiensis]
MALLSAGHTGDVEKGEPPPGPASADAAGLIPPAASAPHKSAPAPSSWPPPHQPAMVLRESPFPNRVLGGLYGLAQGLLYPSFWAANCLLDLKETTVEREQHRLQRCPPYALQATAKGLALVLLFVFSLPVALLGLVLWLPLQAARRPFAYQHTMPAEPWQGWELPGRDRAFSFVTANICLLPDGLAKFSNLGQTRQRAAILAKRLTSPASSYGAMHHNPQVPGAHGHRDKPEGRITASLPPELDFLCLQEVFDGQAAAVLRRQLGVRFEHILYDVGVYGFYRGCNFKVLNSGLFLASRYPVLDVQYHCYPNSTVEDALAAKGMLSVQVLLGMTQGKRIVGYISCTHLFAPADGAQIRSEQLTLGLRWIQQFQEMQAQPGDLVAFDVLCGDLNFDNCSIGDKVEQTHALFHWYQDPCRLEPQKDKAWAVGTLLRYLKIHDEAVSNPENLESTLEHREGQHEYLEPPILSDGRPDPAAEKTDWRGRRIDYILHRAQPDPGPGPLSLHSEVETVSFITCLADCSDHMALGLRLSVSPA